MNNNRTTTIVVLSAFGFLLALVVVLGIQYYYTKTLGFQTLNELALQTS
jgi:hypothetical protein